MLKNKFKSRALEEKGNDCVKNVQMPVHSLVDEGIACTCVNHCRATYLLKKHFWQHSSSKTIVGLPGSDHIKVQSVKLYKRAMIPI